MNAFNRVLAILVALLLIAAASLVLLVSLGLLDPQTIGTPWIQDGLLRLRLPEFGMRDIGIVLSALTLLIGLLLLILELTRRETEPASVTLKQNNLGRVTITRNGIHELVNREADRVEGVREVRSEIREGSRGLRILCRLAVDRGANVQVLADEVQQRVKAAVEHHLGQPVGEVAVQTQVVSSKSRTRRVR